ncbi:hypothetical protein F503_04517 [Ophiostoma piceae UAMH 11346]|uniref:DUF3074 domain-containing protein n=1 Tax=Ophiostoma piceae (strain UAMH 11346) TaxID=1262450 RepID=S3D6A3_OPHP1|nr:hypothetical protein F503_04517 [Ophiostoma piceae UAMH 11346]
MAEVPRPSSQPAQAPAASSSRLPQPPAGSIEASSTAAENIAGDSRMLCLLGVPSARFRLLGSNTATFETVIQQLIREAAPLMGSIDDFYNPTFSKKSGWSRKGSKTYTGVAQTGGDVSINVELLTKKLRAPGQDGAEPWACRRSYHSDSATGGTASWDEFYAYMKTQHVDTERAMTDTVVNAKVVAEWGLARYMLPLEGMGRPGAKWSDFTLTIVEMEHRIGSLLDNRVFPVVQVTCQNQPFNEFYVISAPISNWKDYPAAEGSHKLADKDKIVVGSYASVEVFRKVLVTGSGRGRPEAEAGGRSRSRSKSLSRTGGVVGQLRRRLSKRGRLSDAGLAGANPADAALVSANSASSAAAVAPVPDATAADVTTPGANPADNEVSVSHAEGSDIAEWRIEWTMATASHARGNLPLAFQTPVVPGKIAEDVPMFTKWVAAKRDQIAEPVINDVGNLLPADGNDQAGTAAPEGTAGEQAA